MIQSMDVKMIGEISNKSGVWMVNDLPLHPQDIDQIKDWSKIFDNLEARILANPQVEFTTEMVHCVNYAKLIH